MKSKEEILNHAVSGSYDNNDWITQDLGDSHCYAAMDEYAQTLAKEVIEKLSNQDPMLSRTSTIALIKQKFNLK